MAVELYGTFAEIKLGAARMVYGSLALTDAQIKALPTTALTLAPSPGAGLRIKLLSAAFSVNNGGGAYANLNSATGAWLVIQYNGGSYAATYISYDITIGAPTIVDLHTMLVNASTGRRYADFPVPFFDGFAGSPTSGYIRIIPTGSADAENKALELFLDNSGSGNLTGGNAANVGLVTFCYLVEALAP